MRGCERWKRGRKSDSISGHCTYLAPNPDPPPVTMATFPVSRLLVVGKVAMFDCDEFSRSGWYRV